MHRLASFNRTKKYKKKLRHTVSSVVLDDSAACDDKYCSCNGIIDNSVVQCRSCSGFIDASGSQFIDANGNVRANILKKIQNTVRVPGSEYTMNLGDLTVWTPPTLPTDVNWNQYSDRPVASIIKRNNVPSRGSSTRSSITRLRPGSSSAPGKGVDVKHGSYARYLARLKGRGPLREQSPNTAASKPKYGGKIRKFNIVSGCQGNC
jgi:hypothetical protein